MWDDEREMEKYYWYGGRHSSVDQPAATILRVRVQILSTTYQCYYQIELCCEYKNKENEAGL